MPASLNLALIIDVSLRSRAGVDHDGIHAVALASEERRFALDYLFQANPTQMIRRYPRYQELWERFLGVGFNSSRAEQFFLPQDYTDLQVLSQLAWFDEFFLEEPEIAALVSKGRDYSLDDQSFVIASERRLVARVLPAYAEAARRGSVEISASPFYHPILPLLCDTGTGKVSCADLHLPETPFRHPEDARDQLGRGLALHERVFGQRPRGVWPSEGSVSEEVMTIAHQLGVRWMATDEAVLARSLGVHLERQGDGVAKAETADKLYKPYLYEKGSTQMHLLFRDHMLSDLIGFVYSGMNPQEAAGHLIQNIKKCAEPVTAKGKDAVVPIILDGENAWEFYPRSGREFLRRFYDGLRKDPALEAVTFSEALERAQDVPRLSSLVPGSWINANFNIWIGAPEDNRAWEYLSSARTFYSQAAPLVSKEKRELAFEELLIAEGSDWNWWYGPEHHSANDRDFDALYRKHLSNVYHALGVESPAYLAQPIAVGVVRPSFSPQTSYIHPHVRADFARYFDWLGAASYTADRYAGAMHGKIFLLDAIYAGIDERNLYGRLDFIGGIPEEAVKLVVDCESDHSQPLAGNGNSAKNRFALQLEVSIVERKLAAWSVRDASSNVVLADNAHPSSADDLRISLYKNFEFRLPLNLLHATLGSTLRLRFSLWNGHIPLDALPVEGWMELSVMSQDDMEGSVYNYSASS